MSLCSNHHSCASRPLQIHWASVLVSCNDSTFSLATPFRVSPHPWITLSFFFLLFFFFIERRRWINWKAQIAQISNLQGLKVRECLFHHYLNFGDVSTHSLGDLGGLLILKNYVRVIMVNEGFNMEFQKIMHLNFTFSILYLLFACHYPSFYSFAFPFSFLVIYFVWILPLFLNGGAHFCHQLPFLTKIFKTASVLGMSFQYRFANKSASYYVQKRIIYGTDLLG